MKTLSHTLVSRSLRWNSFWNLCVGTWILIWQGFAYLSAYEEKQEILFILALGLFHYIFAIWYWKGRMLTSFAAASVAARLWIAGYYLIVAFLFYFLSTSSSAPSSFRGFFLFYLAVQLTIDVLGAIITWKSLREGEYQIESPIGKELKFEHKNRFLFAVYMFGLGLWILFFTEGFLRFFHFSDTGFIGWKDDKILLGPIHILAGQIILLAYYNFIAVRYRLDPLITAGIRGGEFSCFFLLTFVLLGLLHPMILLLPTVDFISLVSISFMRLRKRKS
ncbi:putative membrane protein [Leptospira inadai serovar Lyme str. 10]|uniref:Uncharacterized protein n=2 Tax=Leptospira inadai serovar Lyme TaxID=293084 RepID=A0ABX4YNW5_9LEPT|nr:hypothetical protein [Leptospira inadai]EQA35751.1 putative membrane protein [Leptospira inadai serovar Lyme str. 10]PNV76968.1 hypothetical protein BES34_001460 [Leptospira inadai serovar Lyme]